MLTLTRSLSTLAATLLLASTAQAVTVVLDATDSGWHGSTTLHQISNENYSAGWSNEEFRNFFIFDLAGLPQGETILAATLRAYNPADGEPDQSYEGGYDSPDATETYELHEVLLAASAVAAPDVGGVVYADLGDGPVFGSYAASTADNGQDIDIALNAAGLAQLQTFLGVGSVALGGIITSLDSQFGTEEFVWGHTDPPNQNQGSPYDRQLILTITPEPGTAGLLAMGLLALGARRSTRGRSR